MFNNSSSRIPLIVLIVFLGFFSGILLAPALEGPVIRYLAGAAPFLIAGILFILARMFMLRQKKLTRSPEESREGSEVGFVVDTFHDLVAQLKEKEKELEILRAAAEERAVRIEAYNENILQSVPSGVISIDNAVTIKSINQSAEQILGIDAKEAVGKKFNDLFRPPLTGLLSQSRTISRAEYSYVTNDRRHIWLGITTSELRNTGGEKIGLIFVFTDLTDIKALQTQVELKQRLSQLGEMSAGIAHEIRNSMSVISGYAKLLGKKVDPASISTVDAIQSEVSSMERIISELLSFAKPSVLQKEAVRLREIIGESVDTVAGAGSSVSISVSAAEPVAVMADRVLLRQALTNLFLNSMEAMPEGGSLNIFSGIAHGKAEVRVQDTGYGIPGDIRDKIFLPFFTTKEQGTGFGLALVQKIIVLHGGSIDVESNQGEGAEFIITLPAVGSSEQGTSGFEE